MASSKNLAIAEPQNNLAFDKVWAELGFAQPTPSIQRESFQDEPEENDDTDWQDFLGYHDEVRR